LHDLTGDWTVPVLMALVAMAPFLWAMLGASRHRLVGQPETGAAGDFSTGNPPRLTSPGTGGWRS